MWNAVIEGVHSHNMPWFTLEAVFYRLIMDECQYFKLGLDPFRPQKIQELVKAESVIKHIATVRSRYKPATPEIVASLLHFSLWSNAADLSRHPDGVDENVAEEAFSILPERKLNNILINDTQQFEEFLYSLPVMVSVHSLPKKVVILADNAGVEFISDLLWADVLISSSRIQRVEFHVKLHPTFVSDVTRQDVEDTLTFVEKVAPKLGARWRKYFLTGAFTVNDHPYYNAYEPYWIMPTDLYQTYSEAEFVVSKGDANARRFHGDRQWDFTTPTRDIISYFPAPLILVRTFKSETVSGVSMETIKGLVQAMKLDWYHSGEYGTIQLIEPRKKSSHGLPQPMPSPAADADTTLSPTPFTKSKESEYDIQTPPLRLQDTHILQHLTDHELLDSDTDPLELEVREMAHDGDSKHHKSKSSSHTHHHHHQQQQQPQHHHHHEHHHHHHHHHSKRHSPENDD